MSLMVNKILKISDVWRFAKVLHEFAVYIFRDSVYLASAIGEEVSQR